ncbi:hypothetical protein ACWGCW_01770 [Streptomyces sp. NPDC054933]
MSIRHAFSAALLVSAALTLTACGPDNPAPAPSKTAAAPSSSAADSKPSGDKSQAPASDNSGCPTPRPGHKLIWVNNVEGAMNNVVATDAAVSCNTKMDEGAFYRKVGKKLNTYAISPDAKITTFSGKNGAPETVVLKNGNGENGIGHVKACADPDGKQYDGAKLPAGYYCTGQDYYDIVVDSHDTITEMSERSGS